MWSGWRPVLCKVHQRVVQQGTNSTTCLEGLRFEEECVTHPDSDMSTRKHHLPPLKGSQFIASILPLWHRDAKN